MFIHGFPYDHTMWDKQIDELKSNYFCVTYDIRGLGQSPIGDGQYTIESFVDDLETIIAELESSQTSFVRTFNGRVYFSPCC